MTGVGRSESQVGRFVLAGEWLLPLPARTRTAVIALAKSWQREREAMAYHVR